ncbi:MAG: helicase SNF2, partial [Oscillospiraceae bacterium]|nr:helicase SNF2 [Oscillospiraceae bacterium]
REYTVASMKGVYPDDIGISYNEKLSDGRMYAITQNVNKYTLAREGSFIGNEKEPEPTIVEYSERDNISFYDNDYSMNQEVSPMGTEVPEEKKSEKHDFVITDENLGEGGAKTKFKANVEAIKLLNKIEAENRLATPEEQEILSKYVGWGGLAQAFDENNDKWENEFKELKELLSPEEYSNARASTINAFYTSPTVINAIYEGLEKIGFKGGKILEPAMGVGNFFGSMPKEIRDNSSLSGVELDSISGRIAKQLYQNADITVSGYEKTNFADNSFDVVVGNVPFGDYKVYDKDYNKYNFNIHDYFFAKSLDKVHPGGVVAFVTSQGTMDKKSSEIRQYIAERSELLGAIRLPNDAFKSNAGTEVTSDILFLKKRERPIAVDEHSEEWLGRTFIDENIPVNNYFAKNPDMILGTMVQGNKMYGGEKSNSTMCIPKENSSLKEELKKAINNLQGEYVANTKSYEEKSSSDEVVYATPDIKRYSYAIINDELYYRADGNTMKKVEMPKKNEEICKSMIELRKIATELLDLQVHNINYSFEAEITTKRQELNEKYDKFVSNYGLINSKTNAKIFGDDSGYHLLKSLEVKVKDEEKELYKSEYKKADIFTKNTINPISLIEKVDNSNDALLLSLAEKLKVDFEYMSKISDIPEEQLVEELSSSGLIFQNPDNDMEWESADEYLTGNIREKLDIARNSGLEQNIIALEKVLPPDIEAQDISVKLGAYWIPEKYIRDFIIDTFNPNYSTRMNLNVIHEPHSDAWSVEGYNLSYNDVLVNETYGFNDGRNNGYKLIEMALNNQQPKIHKDKLDENGNVVLDAKGKAVRELDTEKTVIIQSKQNALIKKFSEWIMEEPNRRADIV